MNSAATALWRMPRHTVTTDAPKCTVRRGQPATAAASSCPGTPSQYSLARLCMGFRGQPATTAASSCSGTLTQSSLGRICMGLLGTECAHARHQTVATNFFLACIARCDVRGACSCAAPP